MRRQLAKASDGLGAYAKAVAAERRAGGTSGYEPPRWADGRVVLASDQIAAGRVLYRRAARETESGTWRLVVESHDGRCLLLDPAGLVPEPRTCSPERTATEEELP